MAQEEISICPICGHTQFKDLFSVKDHTTTGESFQLKVCQHCQLIATSPRPDERDIASYYESQSYISHTGGNSGIFDTLYRIARKRALQTKLNLLNTYQPTPGTILDYGAGTGSFIHHCSTRQWNAHAVEPSRNARAKIPASVTTYPDIESITINFNAITLWHVLEHVHQLTSTLTKLTEHLSSTGTIFIAVPNHQSHDAQYYGSSWAGYDVPRHLWHFNKTNMTQLLGSVGLKLLAIKPMKLDSFYVSLLSEQYKNPTSSAITRAIAAFMTGLRSNLKAGNNNYSSLIYIAAK